MWVEMLGAFAGVIVAVGGIEFFKWWNTRKSHKQIKQEEANQEKLETKKEDFKVLKEVNQFLQEQLKDKELRFAEQTNMVRDLNRQLLDETINSGKLQAKISTLEAERALKLCERRACKQRMPQSGY